MTVAKPTITPSLFYNDPKAALSFLEKAFGFELTMCITDESGHVVHSEMAYGDGAIMIGSTDWAPWPKSPASLDGKNTQGLHMVVSGLDAHCETARAAGAEIVAEPEDQFYGDRTYRALDCEGHFWTFSETVKEVSLAEMEAATGLKIDTGAS